LIPSSKLLASKPRDCTLKREQNSCYEHDNGLITKFFYPWAAADVLATHSRQYLRSGTELHPKRFNRISRRITVNFDGTEWAFTAGWKDLQRTLADRLGSN
jgi:hypothetical protein